MKINTMDFIDDKFYIDEDTLRRAYVEYPVNPLSDIAFKKLIESDIWYKHIVESIVRFPIPDGHMLSIQGEFALTVNGKLIRMDNLRKTPIGNINLDAQREYADFPFKRHLYYWSVAYILGLKAGEDYNVLKPAISIVIYADKGKADLIETASLQGSLISSADDMNQLSLIAVNCSKWHESADPDLRAMLSILHIGLHNDSNAQLFNGVDVNSDFFKAFNEAVFYATLPIKYQKAKERRDTAMTQVYEGLLTDEQKKKYYEMGVAEGVAKGIAEGVAKGEAKGVKKAFNIVKLINQNKPIDEIVKELGVAKEEVLSAYEFLK